MNPEIRAAIEELLYHEAYLLDHRRYGEWLDLFTDDVVYRMPVRVTRERRAGSDVDPTAVYFDETKASLEKRVKRLSVRSAWVEENQPRHRHFVSNVVVRPTERPDEYAVRSYFLVLRSRGSDPDVDRVFGEREDRVRHVEGQWKIAARELVVDEAVLHTINLAMFL
ncbi:MAG: 3-phenylpropionate/cinnamic acid dioxygenase subunit beta [Firmicutes bacterium]|nr:3-phenylpropionate/cinnamic acid dioxygenase subunit beta [Alicyclobacillaceae bacterium]MCL6498299.1 3-phenylpropionate/cinnamic acid dioxygenase subunit beta [Bacillota bacterium]